MSFFKPFASLATAALMAAAFAGGAQAADRYHGGGIQKHQSKARLAIVNLRIANQNRRIRHGRHAGRLNWVEARRLKFELSHIRGFRARHMRDGYMSRTEKTHLDRLLNANSRRIRQLATNGNWRRNDRGFGDRYSRPLDGRPVPRRLGHLNGFGAY